MLVGMSGARSNTPLMATPARTRSAGTPATLLQSLATMAAVRCPPAEWPVTTGCFLVFCQMAARQSRNSATMSMTETAGHSE